MLEIPENSDQDVAREAYLKLVKKVHPDSGGPEASADRFTEIDNAFKTLQAKFAKERRGIADEPEPSQEFDIKVKKKYNFLSFISNGNTIKIHFVIAYSSSTSSIFKLRWTWLWIACSTRKTIPKFKSN